MLSPGWFEDEPIFKMMHTERRLISFVFVDLKMNYTCSGTMGSLYVARMTACWIMLALISNSDDTKNVLETWHGFVPLPHLSGLADVDTSACLLGSHHFIVAREEHVPEHFTFFVARHITIARYDFMNSVHFVTLEMSQLWWCKSKVISNISQRLAPTSGH